MKARLKKEGKVLTDEQILQRIQMIDSGVLHPNGKPVSSVVITRKKKADPADEAPQFTPPTRSNAAKPVKPPKVFPSTIGQVRYRVEPPGEKAYDVLIDPHRVDVVRAKFEARNALFTGPIPY